MVVEEEVGYGGGGCVEVDFDDNKDSFLCDALELYRKLLCE